MQERNPTTTDPRRELDEAGKQGGQPQTEREADKTRRPGNPNQADAKPRK